MDEALWCIFFRSLGKANFGKCTSIKHVDKDIGVEQDCIVVLKDAHQRDMCVHCSTYSHRCVDVARGAQITERRLTHIAASQDHDVAKHLVAAFAGLCLHDVSRAYHSV